MSENAVEKTLSPENWPINSLRPYDNNAKIHTDEQVSAIAKSIEKHGFDQPIVVDGEGVIIKGHGRWAACKKLGMQYVPVIVRTDLTAAQANASRLADNRVAVGDLDTKKLHSELNYLADSTEIDIQDLGFSEKELSFMTVNLIEMNEEVLASEETLTESTIGSIEEDYKKIESKDVMMNKVFGFAKIPGEYAKTFVSFQNIAEAETGKSGPDALRDFMEKIIEQQNAG
jgi:ParB-like chromosome segregation protein Spo0J